MPDERSFVCRYVKFDTFHPAVERGLPVTRVIGRTLLQAILAEATTREGGPNVIMNGAHVVEYKEKVHLLPSPVPSVPVAPFRI